MISPEKADKLVSIVQGMNSQGMSRAEIKETLKQLGLEPDDIGIVMEKARPAVTPSELSEKTDEIHETLRSGEHLGPALSKLDEHSEHFDRIHASLNGLADLRSIKAELDEVKDILLEIKPVLSAIQKLDRGMLELNRKVLTRAPHKEDDEYSF
jgi:DNA-binding transcriptional MerR regulator